VLDPNSPQHEILSRFSEKVQKITPLIPLGARGVLKGIQLECIGFMIRSDKTNTYSWEEYLLYNPQQGFRWIGVQNGHASFITPLKSPPIKKVSELYSHNFKYRDLSFRKYTEEPAIVRYVIGEFYWSVAIGESVQTVDFICPPYMLSFEVNKSETVASLGEYLPLSEVCSAFKLSGPSSAFGVAPSQPNPYMKDADKVLGLSVLFFLVIFIMGSIYSYENAVTFSMLLFGYVFFYYSRKNGIERQRWENSDFAPSYYREGASSIWDSFDD
jgi:Ni/Co efflux regulator RcnB